MDISQTVKGYELLNADKVLRVLEGSPTTTGVIEGGIMQSDGTFDEDELLAMYDKLGGAIKKNGDTVKLGSFYDFKLKAPRKTPQVVLTFRINGQVVDVAEEAETPAIVKAARVLEAQEVEKKEKKAKK
jgi:hypothetical protein